MKKHKEISEMYSFIGFFNDGRFMNQDYRKGILDALNFVRGYDNSLVKIKEHFTSKGDEK